MIGCWLHVSCVSCPAWYGGHERCRRILSLDHERGLLVCCRFHVIQTPVPVFWGRAQFWGDQVNKQHLQTPWNGIRLTSFECGTLARNPNNHRGCNFFGGSTRSDARRQSTSPEISAEYDETRQCPQNNATRLFVFQGAFRKKGLSQQNRGARFRNSRFHLP